MDVLDELGEKHDNCDTSDEAGELPDDLSEVSEEEAPQLMQQFLSHDLVSDEEDEDEDGDAVLESD